MRIWLGRSRNKGSTVVEFALVSWIFFFVIFATFEFGWYLFVEHTIQHATHEGTRLALVGSTLKDLDGKDMSREASIITKIQTTAATAVKPDQLVISIYPVGPDYTDPPDWQNTVDAGEGGDNMRVRVQYTYNFITPFIKPLFPDGISVIKASSLFRNELF